MQQQQQQQQKHLKKYNFASLKQSHTTGLELTLRKHITQSLVTRKIYGDMFDSKFNFSSHIINQVKTTDILIRLI